MRTLTNFGLSFVAAAVLAGCGGSGEPSASVADGGGSPVLPTATTGNTIVEQTTVAAQADDSVNSEVAQSDSTSAEADQSTSAEADQSASAEPEANTSADESVAVDSQQAPEPTSENTAADGLVTQVDESSSAVQTSFCDAAATTAVSFEDYFSNSPRPVQLGAYVPFPASGFGWDGNNLCDMTSSFGVDTVELLVPFVAKRADIDGVVATNEWRAAAVAGTSNFETSLNDIDNLLVANVPDYIDGSGYSRWKAMHDGTNLYIHVRSSTDTGRLFLDSDQPWHDDSFEIFIDGDNSKGEEFDGVNDFQVSLSADSSTFEPLNSGMSAPGLGVFYKSVSDGSTHPAIEIAINLESAGIEIGKPFGFDVHINEDDNGGDRDAKWGWFEKSGFDRSWFNPSVLGTLLLTDCEDRNACGSFQQLSP